VQQQFRAVGVQLDLVSLEGPVWMERRSAGDFDIDFSTATQEPSPSVLLQSWSCNGSSNVAKFCDPVVDSLLERAILARTAARDAWHDVLRRIEEDAPATFLYAPIYVFAVNRRFDNVAIRPESSWIALWRWSVRSPSRVGAAGY
jgi:ABC-type transport system substrate-binding protein